MREAAEAIEALLASYQKQEAYKRISSCYRQVTGRHAPPSMENLDQITTERAEIYRCRPPDGIQLPIVVTPTEVENGVPEES